MIPRCTKMQVEVGKSSRRVSSFDLIYEDGNNLQVFPGIYTYPIYFQIPADLPPTMLCDYGAVSWRLHAHVHRPGAFRHKYTAEHPVIVVSCPADDDIEETENIIIERHWDHQLQYLIAVSGRSFYIGGTLPVTFTLMPLSKAKVYRIAVYLEGKLILISFSFSHTLENPHPPKSAPNTISTCANSLAQIPPLALKFSASATRGGTLHMCCL